MISLAFCPPIVYNNKKQCRLIRQREEYMKHIKVIATNTICKEKGTGCGECQTGCQSACKTSCTVGNQSCEQKKTNRPEIKVEK